MFTIGVEMHFWASHQLTLPDGSKEPPHQHNWAVTANVSSKKLNSMGLVMDFCQLKEMLNNIVAELDNSPLDEIDYFRRNNSSAENVAKYIYEKLKSRLPGGVKLENIRIIEEPGCSANFTRNPRRKKNVREPNK
jgi:6-pyruvoyltetrahydropterin/6-carboxytetrahydropterin synthase